MTRVIRTPLDWNSESQAPEWLNVNKNVLTTDVFEGENVRNGEIVYTQDESQKTWQLEVEQKRSSIFYYTILTNASDNTIFKFNKGTGYRFQISSQNGMVVLSADTTTTAPQEVACKVYTILDDFIVDKTDYSVDYSGTTIYPQFKHEHWINSEVTNIPRLKGVDKTTSLSILSGDTIDTTQIVGSSDKSWCKVNEDLSVTIGPNNGPTKRSGVVTYSYKGKTVQINITQEMRPIVYYGVKTQNFAFAFQTVNLNIGGTRQTIQLKPNPASGYYEGVCSSKTWDDNAYVESTVVERDYDLSTEPTQIQFNKQGIGPNGVLSPQIIVSPKYKRYEAFIQNIPFALTNNPANYKILDIYQSEAKIITLMGEIQDATWLRLYELEPNTYRVAINSGTTANPKPIYNSGDTREGAIKFSYEIPGSSPVQIKSTLVPVSQLGGYSVASSWTYTVKCQIENAPSSGGPYTLEFYDNDKYEGDVIFSNSFSGSEETAIQFTTTDRSFIDKPLYVKLNETTLKPYDKFEVNPTELNFKWANITTGQSFENKIAYIELPQSQNITVETQHDWYDLDIANVYKVLPKDDLGNGGQVGYVKATFNQVYNTIDTADNDLVNIRLSGNTCVVQPKAVNYSVNSDTTTITIFDTKTGEEKSVVVNIETILNDSYTLAISAQTTALPNTRYLIEFARTSEDEKYGPEIIALEYDEAVSHYTLINDLYERVKVNDARDVIKESSYNLRSGTTLAYSLALSDGTADYTIQQQLPIINSCIHNQDNIKPPCNEWLTANTTPSATTLSIRIDGTSVVGYPDWYWENGSVIPADDEAVGETNGGRLELQTCFGAIYIPIKLIRGDSLMQGGYEKAPILLNGYDNQNETIYRYDPTTGLYYILDETKINWEAMKRL